MAAAPGRPRAANSWAIRSPSIPGRGEFVPGWDREAVLARWERESRAFAEEKAAYHLYERG